MFDSFSLAQATGKTSAFQLQLGSASFETSSNGNTPSTSILKRSRVTKEGV